MSLLLANQGGGASLTLDLSDTASTTDALVVDIAKALAEIATPSASASLGVALTKDDAQGVADGATLGIGLSPTDAAGATDAVTREGGLVVQDVQAALDSLALDAVLTVSDDTSASEAFAASMAFSVMLLDLVTIKDAERIDFGHVGAGGPDEEEHLALSKKAAARRYASTLLEPQTSTPPEVSVDEGANRAAPQSPAPGESGSGRAEAILITARAAEQAREALRQRVERERREHEEKEFAEQAALALALLLLEDDE